MSQNRYPLADKPSQTPNAWASAVEGALGTIETSYSGTTDPSTGHSWGVDQVGIVWKDTTNPYAVRWREWNQVDGIPSYGWRDLGARKIRYLTSETSLSTTSTSPSAADVAYEDFDLSADLDSVQDSGQTAFLVSEAILRVRFRAGVAETLGADDGYLALRAKGATSEKRLYASRDGGLGGRWDDREVVVPLNGSEIAQFSVKVGGGTKAFEWDIRLVGFMEPVA